MVVDARRGTGHFAVVDGGIEIDDAQAGFEEVDAGQEGLALDAVLVEVVGRTVGGGDEDDAVAHEGFEESGLVRRGLRGGFNGERGQQQRRKNDGD